MELPVLYDTLTREDRWKVRKAYIELQKGLCAHCKAPLTGPPIPEVQEAHIMLELFPVGFLENPTHLHHCHVTGYTIGVVHSRCNAWLWCYRGE